MILHLYVRDTAGQLLSKSDADCCLVLGEIQVVLVKQILKSHVQWEFQDPKMEVPTIYIRPIFQAYVSEYHHKIWPYMVQYLHFRILEISH